MTFPSGEFQLTLPSNTNSQEFPYNRPASYKTRLAEELDLIGKWQVALMEIEYPRIWFNLQRPALVMFIEGAQGTDGAIKDGDMLDMYNQAVWASLRDESVNVWEAMIQPGYYASPQVLGNHLVKVCKESYHANLGQHNNKQLQFEFKYDAIDGRCKFEGAPLVMAMPNASPILQMLKLGFLCANNAFSYGVTPVQSSGPVYNESWSSFYVYTDIIQPQLVGDQRLPLIGVVPIMNKDFEVAHWTFNPPYYLPLSRSNISTVDIELKTDKGETLPIQKGKVVCRMHFRKLPDN